VICPHCGRGSDRPEEDILQSVSDKIGVSKKKILSKSRRREYSDSRALVAWCLRYKLDWTTQRIGDYLGRNHSTVLDMFKTAEYLRGEYEDIFTFTQTITGNQCI